MNKICVVLLLCFSSVFGQVTLAELTGKWVKMKTEMKDGSKLFARFEEDSSYISFTIKKKEFCINSNPIHKSNESCLNYELVDNYIKTSVYSGYTIERVSKDSLVLTEKIDGYTDDKLRRYYLLNQHALNSYYKEKYKFTKHVVASRFYTPTTETAVEGAIYVEIWPNYSKFELSGSVFIYPKKRRIVTEIPFATYPDSSSIRSIKKVLNRSYSDWNLENFKDYDVVELPFVLKKEIEKHYRGIKMLFFTDDIDELSVVKGGDAADNRKSGEYFQTGITAYQEKKYQEALDSFTKSYALDPKNLDALYNKAAVYYEMGDLANACTVWEQISKLGQVTGNGLHHKYCE
jgi:tetratricopeptide (TPR) repeat protein